VGLLKIDECFYSPKIGKEKRRKGEGCSLWRGEGGDPATGWGHSTALKPRRWRKGWEVA